MPSASAAIREQLGITSTPLTWADAGPGANLNRAHRRSRLSQYSRESTRRHWRQRARPRRKRRQKWNRPRSRKYPSRSTFHFDEFQKIELKVGKIVTAERVPGATKLLQLTVDIGAEIRQVVAGIAQWYIPEDLIGRSVVVVANLAPAKIRGVESRGMLLAADVEGSAVLLMPDKEVPAGAKVR